MNTKLIGTGIMLAVLLATVGIGIAGADSASVVATYTSTYAPATCALSVAAAGPTPIASIDLSAGGTLYVENSGSLSSTSEQSNMAVTLAFNDASAGAAADGGWYTGSTPTPTGTWVPDMSTTWSATGTGGANGPWDLQAQSLLSEGAAYGSLTQSNGYQPISFAVTAPTTLTAGTYVQQIVISGSC